MSAEEVRAALEAAGCTAEDARKVAAFLRAAPALWTYAGGLRQINNALAEAVEEAAS
jgi:hypothetical protein